MNLSSRIRHRFNRTGPFDLRRRVLLKNFLQHHKVKYEDEIQTNQEETREENHEHDNANVNNDLVLDPCEFIPEEKEDVNVVLEDYSDTLEDKENISNKNDSNVEQSESLQTETESHISTGLRQKLKRFSFRRKCKKNPSSTLSRTVEETKLVLKDDSQTLTKSVDFLPESLSILSDSEVKLSDCELENRFNHSTENTITNVRGTNHEHVGKTEKKTVKGKNFLKISMQNKSLKNPFRRMLTWKQRKCNKSVSVTTLSNIHLKSSQPLQNFFQFRNFPLKSSKRKSVKRKSDSGIEVTSRSVSIQTDLTILPETVLPPNNEYNRASKRSKTDTSYKTSCTENQYWLRSFNNNLLKPINASSEKLEQSKSPSLRSYYPDSSKIVRSQSLQESKTSNTYGPSCRRVKSVYMRNPDFRQSQNLPYSSYHTSRPRSGSHVPLRKDEMFRNRNPKVPLNSNTCCSLPTKLDSLF